MIKFIVLLSIFKITTATTKVPDKKSKIRIHRIVSKSQTNLEVKKGGYDDDEIF